MPHPHPSWPRRLRRLGVYVLLGLGTTIAIAWATEAWSPVRLENAFPYSMMPAEWFVDVPSSWPTAPEGYIESRGIGRTITSASFDSLSILSVREYWQQVELRLGLPLRSLRRVEIINEPVGPAADPLHLTLVQTGLPLPPWLVVIPSDDRRLPLLPLWPGLVGNTLFYALLWWLGLAHWHLVRRDRRFRRGLCPICRYDLRFDYSGGCSECGWRRA